MDFQELVGEVMSALGEMDDAIEAIAQRGDSTWLVVRGEIGIEIELDVDDGVITLFTDLGSPAAERRQDVCELLLAYNMLTRETGGVRAALDKPGGALMLIFDFGVMDLTPQLCAQILADFAAKAEVWQDYVLAEPGAGPVPAPEEYSGFIRV